MNLELLRARRRESTAALRALHEQYETRDDDFSDEDQAEWDRLEASIKEDGEQIAKLERRFAALDAANTAEERDGDHPFNERGFNQNRQRNLWDLSDLRWDVTAAQLRSRAQAAIESTEHLDDRYKEAALFHLRSVDRRGELSTLILVTGNPHYRTAFPKMVSGNEWALTNEERQALLRAQSTSDAAGGYAIPFVLDPTLIITNDGAINPMRQIASVKTITTGEWNGVRSAGATANWRGEFEEVSDDSFTLDQPTIPVHKMDIFIPYSIEIEMDWPQLESELREAIVDAKNRKEATAHINGTGVGQPTGIVTALAAASPSVTVAPLVAETFAVGDVYGLRRRVPPRHRMNRDMLSWLANLGTYDGIRQFDTGGGGNFWTDLNDGTPERLLGHRTYEASEMDDLANLAPAQTDTTNRILIAGEFKWFNIVDRVGMRMENIPHLFHTANNRPYGARGLYAMLRTGSDSVNDNAFRMLNIPTAA